LFDGTRAIQTVLGAKQSLVTG